jgi:hypothetical protein
MDVFNKHYMLDSTEGAWGALEGDYFRATNTTIGTGIVSPTGTSFSSTSAILVMSNSSQPYNPRKSGGTPYQEGTGDYKFTLGDGSQFGLPEYVRLTVTAADVGATSFQWAVVLDSVNRYSSGGQVPAAPTIGIMNVLGMGLSGYAPKHNIQIGAVVTTAESGTTNPLHCGRGAMKSVTTAPLCLVGDEFLWTFTRLDNAVAGLKGGGTSGTNPQVYRQSLGPSPIPPGGSLVLHAWFPGMTGAFSFEYEIGWSELPF